MAERGDTKRSDQPIEPALPPDPTKIGKGDCDQEADLCKPEETLVGHDPIIDDECFEVSGECEDPGEDLWNTAARFYISKGGDIINDGILSDPESIHSATTIEDDLDLPEDDDFRIWAEIDPSDDEEQVELKEKYFDLFKVNEPEEVFQGEEDLSPEDGDYWKEYFEHHYTNQHVNVHHPEKFLALNLHHDRVTDLSFIPKHFPALKFLDISKNFVQNVRCLGKLKDLVHLNASDNEITRFLDICTKKPHPLVEIDLSKNQITQIIPFNRFMGLVNVNLAYNRLKLINHFQYCYFLRFLNLSHNEISEIKNLDCPNLLVLLLQDNELESLDSLERCHDLRYLNISKNKISNLTVLQAMPRLVQLRAKANLIGLKELDVLKCLIYMTHLRLALNPCTDDIPLSRQMLIFTLPQIRYLDKKIILPEEIVEASNIFKPTFDKIAFEDYRNTMLEKASQSGYMMFREFSEMFPLPPMLFLVGTFKSHMDDLAVHLKQKFHHQIIFGGVHSTATTIESGNHYDTIPISVENFMEMKNRGQFFSTSTILGRLCGFSATQFIKAVEHGALLVAISIPLETAICLRKWGFKSTNILVEPSDAPHFNVDAFLAKEKRRQSLHLPPEPPPKIHENRQISFSEAPTDLSLEKKMKERQSILKHHETEEISRPELLVSKASSTLTVAQSTGFVSGLDEPFPVDDDLLAREWAGEVDDLGSLNVTVDQISTVQEKVTLFGVEILNPASIEGIDWKRTILLSNFYEAILVMDEDFHFLVTRHSVDPSIELSREILEKTISALGYVLVHGPTSIYMKDEKERDDEAGLISYQLIVVKPESSSSKASSTIQSCIDFKMPARLSVPFLLCEDAGEGDGYTSYLRPASPWYRPITGEEEVVPEEDEMPITLQKVTEDEETHEDICDHSMKFKHRNALEFSILRTREEYLKFHLTNPGFFSTVLDTRDLEESQKCVEEIVAQMLQATEFDVNRETSSKNYTLLTSYAQMCSPDDSLPILSHRFAQIKETNDNLPRGFQPFTTEDTEFETRFTQTPCPRNLFCTNFSRGYAQGQVCQLQRAGARRLEKEQGKEAFLRENFRPRSTCPEPFSLEPVTWPELIGEESPGEVEFPGESRTICRCGEDCTCQPPRRRTSYTTFKTTALLTEFGYDADG